MSKQLPTINLVSIVFLFTLASVYEPRQSDGREIDALLIQPLADTFKSLISTITTGSSLQVNFSAPDVARNLVALSWQTGFPLTMPSNLAEKTGIFLHQLKERINAAPTEGVIRRGLEGMRNDTGDIIDAIVDEIRRSPDGLYTDLTQTKVNAASLQDAMVSLGQQLKAFGGDLRYYQDIAKQVLGVPVLPDMASVLVGVTDRIPASLSVNKLGDNLMSVQSSLAHSVQSAASSVSSLRSLTSNLPGLSAMSSLIGVRGSS